MTCRLWRHISCPWDTCLNHLTISDLFALFSNTAPGILSLKNFHPITFYGMWHSIALFRDSHAIRWWRPIREIFYRERNYIINYIVLLNLFVCMFDQNICATLVKFTSFRISTLGCCVYMYLIIWDVALQVIRDLTHEAKVIIIQ